MEAQTVNYEPYSFEERMAIRRAYELNSNCHPGFFQWKFTYLQKLCWHEIRCTIETKHFRPEFPIGRYFANFADPVNKIILECDSKMKKNAKDLERLNFFEGSGWTLFLLTPGMILSNIIEKEILVTEKYEDGIEQQKDIEKYKTRCIGCLFRSEEFRKLVGVKTSQDGNDEEYPY